MLLNRKRAILGGSLDSRFLVAVLFAAFAGFSAVAHAETRAVEGLEFDAVIVWGGAEVEITQEDQHMLRLRGKEKYLDLEPFYLRGNTLHLGRSESGKSISRVQYKVSAPMLERIKLSGSGDVYVRPLEAGDIDITVEGSGDIMIHELEAQDVNLSVAGSGTIQLAKATLGKLDLVVSGSGGIDLGTLTAAEIDATINGSGDIRAAEEGQAGQLSANLMGSGDIDVRLIEAREVDVNVIGSGDAEVWAVEDLEASVMGSGDVTYRGDPEVRSNVLGSGDVERDD